MRQKHHECNCYSENAIEVLGLIEDDKNENGEGDACEYGTKRYISRKIKYKHKNPYAADCYIRLNTENHAE